MRCKLSEVKHCWQHGKVKYTNIIQSGHIWFASQLICFLNCDLNPGVTVLLCHFIANRSKVEVHKMGGGPTTTTAADNSQSWRMAHLEPPSFEVLPKTLLPIVNCRFIIHRYIKADHINFHSLKESSSTYFQLVRPDVDFHIPFIYDTCTPNWRQWHSWGIPPTPNHLVTD